MFKVKLLQPYAIVPKRVTKYAAGLDCFSPFKFVLDAGERMLVKLGFALELQTNTVGLLKPCSGLALRYGLDVQAGVIDSDYRGEVCVLLYNTGRNQISFEQGDKICQLLVVPCFTDFHLIPLDSDEQLSTTYRGNAGFGAL